MKVYEATTKEGIPIIRVLSMDEMDALDDIHQTLFILDDHVWEMWMIDGENFREVCSRQ